MNHALNKAYKSLFIFESAIEDGLCAIDPTRSKHTTYSKKQTVRKNLAIEDAPNIINFWTNWNSRTGCWWHC